MTSRTRDLLAPASQQELTISSFGPFLAFSLLISLCGVYITRSYLMDDALITLRYSYNFARFGVPIWNPADWNHPSMGYTSLFWMSMNTIPALLTSNKDALVFIAKSISLIPLAGIVLLISRAIFSLRISSPMKYLASFTVFSQIGYGFHVNSAMETMLFSFLVLSTVLAYSRSHYRLAYALGCMSFLARPEGALLVALLCLGDLTNRRVRQALLGGAAFICVLAGTCLLLYHWYGDILPNPFYAKQEMVNTEAVVRTAFFIATLAFPFLVISIYAVFVQMNRVSCYMLVPAVVYLIYYATVDPIMNVLSRYQWPSLVLLTYASIPLFEFLSSNIKREKIIATLFLLMMLTMNFGNALGASYFADTEGHAMGNVIMLGKKMAEYRDPEQWLVYHDAGAVCYFSDWNTHEIVGLTNGQIARGEIRLADIYRNPNAQIVLRDFDLMAEGQETAKHEYSDQLLQYGFHYIQDIPILSVAGQRKFVIAVYARDIDHANQVFGDVRVSAPLKPSISYVFYSIAKRIVRGQ